MAVQKASTSFLNGFLIPIVLRVGLPLFAWTLLVQYVDQRLVEATQNELISESGPGYKLWLFGGLSMLTSILGPVFSMMMIFFAIRAPKENNLFQYIKSHLSWLFKEQLRAAGQMILWGLLFLLPGFWKFLEFVMLPFVVCLDERYQRGEIDALKTSRGVFKQIWGRVILIILLFFAASVAFTSVDEYRSFTDHPISAISLVLIDLMIFVLFQWGLLRFWESARRSVAA